MLFRSFDRVRRLGGNRLWTDTRSIRSHRLRRRRCNILPSRRTPRRPHRIPAVSRRIPSYHRTDNCSSRCPRRTLPLRSDSSLLRCISGRCPKPAGSSWSNMSRRSRSSRRWEDNRRQRRKILIRSGSSSIGHRPCMRHPLSDRDYRHKMYRHSRVSSNPPPPDKIHRVLRTAPLPCRRSCRLHPGCKI